MKLRINHFNINVVNLQNSIKFYQDNLDMHILREKQHPNNDYHLVYMADDTNNVTIELTWIKSKIGKYDLGDNEFHIAFTTDDFENTYKRHKDAGVIIYENPKMGVYFIGDPDGYWIEITKEKK